MKEAGDGNLNLVFIVANRDEPAQAVIAKQALNYLRVAGESCPGLVPKIYDDDEEMSLMVMEYLGTHEIMRKALVERQTNT